MRQVAMFLLVLNSCAHAVAPASRPALPAPTGLTSAVVLDEQGVRELLAGVELELGDERAKTAAAQQREAEARRWTLISGIVGAVLGAVVGLGLGVATHR